MVYIEYKMAMRLTDFDAIGFDVDHTLVHYKLENIFPLIYHSLAKFLVETKGYPKVLSEESFNKYAGFCSRGIIFDSYKGNFLKLSKDGKILRASHGTKSMTEEKLKEVYGENKEWESFHEFLDEKPKQLFRDPKFPMAENFFDAPAMLLCARLVDLMDYEETGKDKYRLIWPDVLLALIENFDFRSFGENKENFYPNIKADIHRYVHKCSDKMKTWLQNLRKHNVKLFLITNSQADFSMFVLEAAFGKDWLSYFDVAISRANKPGFFENQRQFLEVENGVAGGEGVRTLKEGKYYAEGNSKDLEKFIGKLVKKPEKEIKVLFFGDSIRSDIFSPKFLAHWQTVALLEEIILEVEKIDDNDEPRIKKTKQNEETPCHKDSSVSNNINNILKSSVWGSIFCENGELMNTVYGSIVDQYSSLVIPGLDCLADLSMDHDFVKTTGCSCRFYPPLERTNH